ncbi:MAG: hypothetical protein RMM17_05990 [Acidobacteriota bacterium]|nr:hypothetical protein [Blastocatellia bacterium]MDW8412218.1 hypothetical protein [Acidobacteriota bacterium]
MILLFLFCLFQQPSEQVIRYLEFLQEEERELRFQLARDELTWKDYRLAQDKIAILKRLVEGYGRSGQPLPELYVVTQEEMLDFVPDKKRLKRLRRGDSVGEKWKFLKRVYRNATHYFVLENRQ